MKDVYDRTTAAIGNVMGRRGQAVIDAIMGGGKTYSSFAAARDRDEPLAYFAPRGELYEQGVEYALENSYAEEEIHVLPSGPRDCPTFQGEYGDAAQSLVWQLFDRGVTLKAIHNLLGDDALPCCNNAGVFTADVEDSTSSEIVFNSGPDGYWHDVEVDPVRDVLHAAYIGGDFVGYVIFDLSDPYCPREISRIDYADRPDYEEIGTAGFENCHQAHYDPERDLAIIGDEVCAIDAVPGGKHIFDIGWDEGSLEDPIHIGFTHSPNAQIQENARFWTTHFHDVISASHTDSGATLLVDGGYHEGMWICDITDPRNPTPAEQYPTRDQEEESADHSPSHAPYCWSAEYNAERDFVFASDTLTGAYTFEISDDPFEFRNLPRDLATIYRCRWEVELLFRELKTQYRLDEFNTTKTPLWRFCCMRHCCP